MTSESSAKQRDASVNDDNQDEELEPHIDGGYAWWILTAYILMGFFTMGMLRIMGIFFLEYIKFFDTSAGTAAWVTSIFFGVANSGVGGFFVPRLGARRVVIIGAFLQTLGICLSSMVTQLWHLFLSISLCYGVGYAFTMGPIIGHVSLYFKKKRGLANGVGTAASSLGTLISAPLVTFLIDEFGLRGALLITAALVSHMFAAALLLRPIESFTPAIKRETGEINKGFDVQEAAADGRIGDTVTERVNCASRAVDVEAERNKSEYLQVFTSANLSVSKQGEMYNTNSVTPAKSGDVFIDDTSSSKQMFVQSPAFWIHVLAVGIAFYGYGNINIILLPARAEELHFTPYQASFFLSVFSIADLFGKLFFGWLLDRPWMEKTVLYVTCMFLMGALTVMLPLVGANTAMILVLLVLLGVVQGVFFAGNFTLLADKCGVEQMQKGLACMQLVLCVPFVFYLQVPAELFDIFGGWSIGIFTCGGSFFITGFILLMEYQYKRFVCKRQDEPL